MRTALVMFACMAGVALSATPSNSKFAWKAPKSARRVQGTGPTPCQEALISVSTCFEENSSSGSGSNEEDSSDAIRTACCSLVNTLTSSCGGTLDGTIVGFMSAADATSEWGVVATRHAMELIGSCPREGTTAVGCADSMSAAQDCVDGANGSGSDSANSNSDSASGECCYEIGQQVHQCIGVSTDNAQKQFFGTLQAQMDATHCPVFPLEMCAAAAQKLNTCVTTASNAAAPFQTSQCCGYVEWTSMFCQYHPYAAYLMGMPASFDSLRQLCQSHGSNNNGGGDQCDTSRIAWGIQWFSDPTGGFPITTNPSFGVGEAVYHDSNSGQTWWRLNPSTPAYIKLSPRDASCPPYNPMP